VSKELSHNGSMYQFSSVRM